MTHPAIAHMNRALAELAAAAQPSQPLQLVPAFEPVEIDGVLPVEEQLARIEHCLHHWQAIVDAIRNDPASPQENP